MEKVTAYKSENGKVFDSEFEALKEDLFLMILGGADNKPCAVLVRDHIVENLVAFAGLLGHMTAQLPPAPDAQPELQLTVENAIMPEIVDKLPIADVPWPDADMPAVAYDGNGAIRPMTHEERSARGLI